MSNVEYFDIRTLLLLIAVPYLYVCNGVVMHTPPFWVNLITDIESRKLLGQDILLSGGCFPAVHEQSSLFVGRSVPSSLGVLSCKRFDQEILSVFVLIRLTNSCLLVPLAFDHGVSSSPGGKPNRRGIQSHNQRFRYFGFASRQSNWTFAGLGKGLAEHNKTEYRNRAWLTAPRTPPSATLSRRMTTTVY